MFTKQGGAHAARQATDRHISERRGRKPSNGDSGAGSGGRRESIKQLVSRQVVGSDAPVLIFEVDAAGIAEEAAPARRADVRLVGYLRGRERGRDRLTPDGDLSAVLVLRALTPSRLLSCVRAVTRNGATIPPEVLCQMLPASPGEPAPGLTHGLTDREVDVLRMLGDGETTRGIAEQLSYSERTVKNIVHDVLVKLGCRTRAHAVAAAARQGVI